MSLRREIRELVSEIERVMITERVDEIYLNPTNIPLGCSDSCKGRFDGLYCRDKCDGIVKSRWGVEYRLIRWEEDQLKDVASGGVFCGLFRNRFDVANEIATEAWTYFSSRDHKTIIDIAIHYPQEQAVSV